MDDFIIADNTDFCGEGDETLTVSKVERDKFRFSGWDIEKYEDQVKVSIEDYSNNLKEITDIRKADIKDKLTKIEMKEYQKIRGKLN